MTDHPHPVTLCAADALAGRLRDAGKDRLLVGIRAERQGHAVRDGWISSIGRKPAATIASRNTVSAAGTSGSAATTSIPSPSSASATAIWRAARTAGSTAPAGPRGT